MNDSKPCAGCGADFERKTKHDGFWRQTLFCSKECGKKTRQARTRARRAATIEDIRRRWLEQKKETPAGK